ncbi:MAG: hypothetical protein ACLRU8_13575 [Intestinibacter bartlettii]|uniref:hypothetical protein n=1 Tax=Intestinibacter bartlettii TaxID=261299 RepID=UPI0039A3A6AA
MNREKELKAVEEIHQASLKILNEIGIKFGLDEVNEIFKRMDLDKKMEEHSLQKNK